jgi:hypothetical protein
MLARNGSLNPSNRQMFPKLPVDGVIIDFICSDCHNQVFSSKLADQLSSPNFWDPIEVRYSRRTDELLQSVNDGCNWCCNLMNSILLAAHQDYWYAHWNGSHSDGSDMNDEGLDAPDPDEQGNIAEEKALEPSDVETDSQDDAEMDYQYDGGLTLSLSDFGSAAGEIRIQLTFSQSKETPTLELLRVEAELEWNQNDRAGNARLVNMEGENTVYLTYDANLQHGKCSYQVI